MELELCLTISLITFLLLPCSVFCNNFPPVENPPPIPVRPPPPQSPLNFGNLGPDERIPDSLPVTDYPAKVPTDAFLSVAQVVNGEWSTNRVIGPVATPRPDDAGSIPYHPDRVNPDYPRGRPSPGISVFSRGVNGQYTEQRWIPFDTSLPGDRPGNSNFTPEGSNNQNTPRMIPPFPTPMQPDFAQFPKDSSAPLPGKPTWIPPPGPPDNIPPNVPINSPTLVRDPPRTIFIIQNGTTPFVLSPQFGQNRSPLLIPVQVNLNQFPPPQFVPKGITFPVPNSIVIPNQQVNSPTITNPPFEETTMSPEATPSPPIPSPPPPLKPSPPLPSFFLPRPYPDFFLKTKDETFRPFFIPTSQVRFDPSLGGQLGFPPKTNVDKSFGNQPPNGFAPPQRPWLSGPSRFVTQYSQKPTWYPMAFVNNAQLPPDANKEAIPSSTWVATQNQAIPPPSSDLWIIRGDRDPKNQNIPPRESTFSPPRDPTFFPVNRESSDNPPSYPVAPNSFQVYPTGVNGRNFNVPYYEQNIQKPFNPEQRPYYDYFNPRDYPEFSRYTDPYSSLQDNNYPYSYQLPFVPYSTYPPSSSNNPYQPLSDNQEVNSTGSQNRDYAPYPAAFLVQPPRPLYLPLPNRDGYTYIPSGQGLPNGLYPQSDSTSDTTGILVSTGNLRAPEYRPQPDILTSEPTPPSPTSEPASDNVVVSPVLPFVNRPIMFPRPSEAVNSDSRRQPYFFGYDQSDDQGALQHRQEEANTDGTVQGSYGYRDADGVYRNVEYIADSDGYRAVVRATDPGSPNRPNADYTFDRNAQSNAARLVANDGNRDVVQTPDSGSSTGQIAAPTFDRNARSNAARLTVNDDYRAVAQATDTDSPNEQTADNAFDNNVQSPLERPDPSFDGTSAEA